MASIRLSAVYAAQPLFNRKPPMTLEYRRSFWAALLAVALLSAAAAWWLFPKAMPLLQLQVSLSRDQALERAASLQAQRFPELATSSSRAAASTPTRRCWANATSPPISGPCGAFPSRRKTN